MAEFVEQRMQRMITEFEELEKLQILSPNEVGKLIQKRRQFEYSITKRRRRKQDYISYVVYDTKLLELLYLRRKEFGEKSKHSTIEGAICKRILHRLSFMTKLWPSHSDIWALRISFSKSRSFDDGVSTIYAEQTRFHGHLESVWVAWAEWEITKRSNFIKARDILLSKAKRYHPNSLFIAREYFRLELLYVRHLHVKAEMKKEGYKISENSSIEDKILDCAVPEVIYRDSVQNFEGAEVYLQFYSVVKEFSFANELKKTIIGELIGKYPNDGVTWQLRLSEDLYGKSEDDESKSIKPKEKIDKIFDFYDQATRVVGSSFINIYFSELMNLFYQCWSASPLFEEVTDKMVSICKENTDRLSKWQFMTWFYVSEYVKSSSEEIKSILSSAISIHPHSSLIKLKFIIKAIDEEEEDSLKIKVFEKHSKFLFGSNGLKSWIKLIESLNEKKNKISIMEKGSNNVDNEIATGVRVYYIKWIFKAKGIKNMRKIYKKFQFAPPLSCDLHAAYICHELRSKTRDIEEVRNALNNAIMQFGSDCTGVWFSYIEFERKYGNASRTAYLTGEAKDKLNAKHLTQFIDLRYIFEDQVEKTIEKDEKKSVKDGKSFVESIDEPSGNFEEKFCVAEGTCKELYDEAPFLNFTETESRKEFFKVLWDFKHFLNEEGKRNMKEKDKNSVWEEVLSYILGEDVCLSLKEIKSDLDEDAAHECVRILDKITLNKAKRYMQVPTETSLTFEKKTPTFHQSEMAEILSHSDVLKPDFLKQKRLEPYFIKKIVLKRRNKKLAKKSNVASDGWFNMKAPSMTKEIRRDMQVLKMRSVLDPKTHYKRNDLKEIPKIFQMGKVVDNPLDFYSSRILKKDRKRTLAEELISDEKGMMYQKRKHAEIVSKLRLKQRNKKPSVKRDKGSRGKKGATKKGSREVKSKGVLKKKGVKSRS